MALQGPGSLENKAPAKEQGARDTLSVSCYDRAQLETILPVSRLHSFGSSWDSMQDAANGGSEPTGGDEV